MRIAAGVLILVVAVMNLMGGCTYTVGGGLIGGGAQFAEDIGKEAADESGDPDAAAQLEKLKATTGDAKAAGGTFLLWGVFLLVLAGLQIAAGVQLFRAKGAGLIKTAAGLEVLSDVVTVAWFGTFIMAGLGLVAAIMAFVSSNEISADPAPVEEPEPEAEPEPEPEAEPEPEPEADAEADGKAEADSE